MTPTTAETTTHSFRHAVPIQIRFNDIDMMGHINNAKIQEYFDIGRVHYFMNLFGELFDGELALVIASNKTDFFYPVLFAHSVEVRTTIYHFGNKSLKMLQQICLVGDGSVVSSCDSVLVCFRKDTKETASIPAEWKETVEKFEGR